MPAEFLRDGTADLAGQRIVLVDELGFGDAIQFFRYLPRIRGLGARIVHVTMPQLVPLLSVAAPHAECVSARTPSTRFDWLAFTSSLPGLFRTQPDTIPAEVPYLQVEADRIARWALAPGMAGAYRVGLVWAGNPRHPGDGWRSIPPAVFLALADVPGAVFCSLQPDVRADGLAAMEAYPQLRRIGAAAADFADTAAVVAQLDLVITVDTAMAHLAGAMARRSMPP
ncbi:MAG TPA: hypothetical protein VFW75_08115 [Acetobacteraceae bacterium]|nr:hypothetical protein [Acetobacteraceae bacterium]